MESVVNSLAHALGIGDAPGEANRAEVVAAAIALFGAFIATCAAAFAVWQIRSAANLQRESLARGMYETYLRTCFEHSDMADADQKAAQDAKSLTGWSTRYEWFVSIMLNAVEGILLYVSAKSEWRETAKKPIAFSQGLSFVTRIPAEAVRILSRGPEVIDRRSLPER